MTITRQFRTPNGYAIRRMEFVVGGHGSKVLTAYFRNGERVPYRVSGK